MIGSVDGGHALLGVVVTSPGRPHVTIDFVVDTGFMGYLTLPLAAVKALGLRFIR